MTWRIVILDPLPPERADRMRRLLPEGWELAHATARGEDHMAALIAEADFAVAGQVGVPGTVLRAARRLRLLHKWGVGTDNLDLDAARELGIGVARTTGSNAVPVAEFTLGLMIAALRGIAGGHAELRQGRWRGLAAPVETFTLSGKTVGIVGFGAIGQALAQLLRGFGCPVLYATRTPLPAGSDAGEGARAASLPELLAQSDVVSLHCPLTPQTAGMIDRRAFALMKPTAVLVNAARGGIVVEDDLVEALRTRRIHAAAMDVFATEPLPADSPLLGLDNLVVTPHLAAMASDTFEPTVRRMFGNFARVARGEAVPELDRVV